MARHAEQHIKDDFIFIGKYKEGTPNQNFHNPSTHRWDASRDQWTFSTSAKLVRVDVPQESKGEDGRIRCRTCKTYVLEFEGKEVKQQMVEAKKMMIHEKKCKGKNKNQETTRT